MEAGDFKYPSIKVSQYKIHLERCKITITIIIKVSVHALTDPLVNMVSLPLSVYENTVILSTAILSNPSHS